MSFARSFLVLAAVVVVSACSSEDDPIAPPGNGGNGDGGGGRMVEDNPSFSGTIQEIFERRGCSASSCHGAARSGGLQLTLGDAYDNLVNVQGVAEPILRVIPSDAEGSYLVIKLEGRQSVGSSMPLGGSSLDNIDLTNIKNWIDQGAANN